MAIQYTTVYSGHVVSRAHHPHPLRKVTNAFPMEVAVPVSDARHYLTHVRVQLANEPTIFQQVLRLLNEFKNGRLETVDVISRIAVLLQGNPELIIGFNTFVPQGYRIDVFSDKSYPVRVTTPSGIVVHPAMN